MPSGAHYRKAFLRHYGYFSLLCIRFEPDLSTVGSFKMSFRIKDHVFACFGYFAVLFVNDITVHSVFVNVVMINDKLVVFVYADVVNKCLLICNIYGINRLKIRIKFLNVLFSVCTIAENLSWLWSPQGS